MSSDSNDHHPTEQPAQAPVDDKSSKPKRGVCPRQRHIAHQQQRSSEEEVKKLVTVSPSATASTAASSITDTNTSDDLSTIPKAYRDYKQAMKHQRCSSLATLHEVIEDIHFFGLHFCGELLNDTPEADDENNDKDKDATISKEERKKAMDNTFLGKMISCGGIHHHDGCFGGDCILSCHDVDAERDDCSGEFL